MKILVGYSPDSRGDDALALAAQVARAAKASLVVVNVRAAAWPARGSGSVDAEWVAYLTEQARAALEQARMKLRSESLETEAVDFVVQANRGSGRGLSEAAKEAGADLIVIGSAPRGRHDRIAIGSTADQLLHGSPVPVLLAPRGYCQKPVLQVVPEARETTPRRLTVAYWRRRDAGAVLVEARRLADQVEMALRLVTLVLRPPGLTRKFRGEEEVMRRQCEQAEHDLDDAAARLGDVETEVLLGSGVAKALSAADWGDGDILACMSSTTGPLRKVFLGDTSGKIVRAAPCPVMVLPRR
jgi:nucleotide-binding universal stress UspA family protein